MIEIDNHQNGVKIETEEDEEEEYEEIIDDEADETEADEANKDAAGANKENACFGLGSLEQPLVKFYFTSPCPELGLDKVCSFNVIANLYCVCR